MSHFSLLYSSLKVSALVVKTATVMIGNSWIDGNLDNDCGIALVPKHLVIVCGLHWRTKQL